MDKSFRYNFSPLTVCVFGGGGCVRACVRASARARACVCVCVCVSVCLSVCLFGCTVSSLLEKNGYSEMLFANLVF